MADPQQNLRDPLTFPQPPGRPSRTKPAVTKPAATTPRASESKPHFRTLFLSDIHLGFRECKAAFLSEFLTAIECDQIYLLGDILDLWSMKKTVYWDEHHTRVIQQFLTLASDNTRITYIPGNHDELCRYLHKQTLMGIHIQRETVHTSADGKRWWLTHGDDFDAAICSSPFKALIGEFWYGVSLSLNRMVNRYRQRFGFPYWSLATYFKTHIRKAAHFIARFEEAVAHEAARRGVDGVICGHIHFANLRKISGITYCNDGDWVDSCSAVVENRDGSLQVLGWEDIQAMISSSCAQHGSHASAA